MPSTLSSPAPSSSGGGDKDYMRLEPSGCQWELQAFDGSGTGSRAWAFSFQVISALLSQTDVRGSARLELMWYAIQGGPQVRYFREGVIQCEERRVG
ncbi:hypothetical protein DUNSADRAFT_5556 [Dunaliella salina]|uniref:Uncharacterized protein n=1 Tax=Dunaliella salina TaxID=3046 RepID=A0ABQ7GPZ6_DUNSA|nr:hypothetical protein DUNSADRAFT_5556 [Dunaliella salina]|eukprot:KAF5836681.1 hypothetical protein DUNSADRAFT_5556 [Dunaliella salina]